MENQVRVGDVRSIWQFLFSRMLILYGVKHILQWDAIECKLSKGMQGTYIENTTEWADIENNILGLI